MMRDYWGYDIAVVVVLLLLLLLIAGSSITLLKSMKEEITSPLAAEKLEGEALVVEKNEPVSEMKSLDIEADEKQEDYAGERKDCVKIETQVQEEDNDGKNNNLEQKIRRLLERRMSKSRFLMEQRFLRWRLAGSTSTRSLDLDSETQKKNAVNEVTTTALSYERKSYTVHKKAGAREDCWSSAVPKNHHLKHLCLHFSGEDDLSSSGAIDEQALIVRKMKESVAAKDRFYKMRRFTSCFLGSEAVDFFSEDQYLEREEATEFGRNLADQLFFQHVLGGLTDVKPKPITEIASRLRFLSYAIFEAYTSEDGMHVDYVSIYGKYLRIVEELQRVELLEMTREEKLAFFINLYNMMAIHAILLWGHPTGALERRRLFGDFRYVIGGSTFSLSAIQNGILRGNQRPPYNLMKPFNAKDKRSKVALPHPEPLVHFALVSGGVEYIIDFEAKVASLSKMLKWFSVDFGKNEIEVLKFVSNYLDPAVSEALVEPLANSQLKVTYQPYDWRLNC
ncbi:hypothetical protein F8388_022274 [Cannabis sativa]|uniref:DUF547 domain-containing protein n=1 Tax=Cannabis sativa TaxID=3483 RepID=A0A7J6E867_CANSA|nr:hypothetical protein F8388_022274 [Cannabis sativa]